MLKWIAATIVIAIGAFAAWDYYKDPRVTVRYRITLDFEVNGKPVSGSSVMEVTVVRGLSNIGAPYGTDLKGEAIVVDLGRDGLVFGILRTQPGGPDFSMLAERVFDRTKLMPNFREIPREKLDVERVWRLERAAQETGRIELQLNEIPQLVRFRDMADPGAAELIKLTDVRRLFEGRVRFVRAYFERTNSPLTDGIVRQLPWVDAAKKDFLNGTSFCDIRREPCLYVQEFRRT